MTANAGTVANASAIVHFEIAFIGFPSADSCCVIDLSDANSNSTPL
jgi:hypothetical protein